MGSLLCAGRQLGQSYGDLQILCAHAAAAPRTMDLPNTPASEDCMFLVNTRYLPKAKERLLTLLPLSLS